MSYHFISHRIAPDRTGSQAIYAAMQRPCCSAAPGMGVTAPDRARYRTGSRPPPPIFGPPTRAPRAYLVGVVKSFEYNSIATCSQCPSSKAQEKSWV